MGEQRIAEVFVELADTLVDDFDVVDFLQSLTERCVELLEASAAGIMLWDRDRLRLVASTSTRTRDLELFELQMDQGPCLDTFATGQPILNVDMRTAERTWPDFTRAAAAIGVRSTSALPMRLRGKVIGALNLFSDHHDVLSATSLALGQAMADIATIGLLNERSLREQTLLSEQLQTALQSRIVIEQAKGVLAARAGISVQEAFDRLRRHARQTGTALTVVATAVVAGEMPNPRGTTGAQDARGDRLGEDDVQILRLMAAGTATSVLAHSMNLTLTELSDRLIAIRRQLRVRSTAQAIAAARDAGLL